MKLKSNNLPFYLIAMAFLAFPILSQPTAPLETEKENQEERIESNDSSDPNELENEAERKRIQNDARWGKSEISVIGTKKTDLKRIPGSATVIEKEFLEKTQPIDATEILRRVPGASVSYQDPAGLTLNLGFRGINSQVSRKVLILEDGVPVALNPYGEPESYYVPQIDRMERVEVVRGSGSILFGPSTIGGVVNFVTKRPPIEPTLSSTTIGGENGYFSQYLSYGGTFGNTGFDINVLRKQGDGFRDHQSFWINEINMKTVTQLNEKHAITTKIGAHQQEANISYLGQTTPQFWNNPKSNFGEQDLREIERYQIVLGHEYTISQDARIKTKTYWNQTRRDWGRQNYSRNNSSRDTEPRNSLREYDTNPFANRPGDTVWMRDDMSFRNRTYRSMGVESKLEMNFETGSVKHELDLGARYHYDQANIRFLSGVSTPDFAVFGNGLDNEPTKLISSPYSLNKSGPLRDDELREAKALAVFIQDRVRLTEKFAVIPGVRYETFTQSRLIRRGRDFDPKTFETIGSASQQLDRSNQTTTNIVIPGFGTTYDFTKTMTWFTGVHRGFAPARYESAISPIAEDIALKPETSWNYETGVRGKATRFLEFQLTGYVMEFEDQIINSSAAGGNLGSRPVNAGRSVHRGIEADMVLDFGKLARSKWEVPFEVIYSRNEAKSDQYTFNLDAWEKGITDPLVHIDTNGNRLPYVSRDVVTVSLGTKAPNGFYVMGEWQYFSKQFHDLENTRTFYGQDLLPNNATGLARFNGFGTGASETNGLNGIIPAYELVNFNIGIRKEKWAVFLVAKNLFDRKYISTRLPEGIQPGPFRQVNVGLSLYL